MNIKSMFFGAALLSGTALFTVSPAAAASFNAGAASIPAIQQAQQDSIVIQVQQRRRGGRAAAPARGPRAGGRRGGGRRGGGIGPGGAAAIGIIGAIGTMMAIDAARQQADQDGAVDYCIRRFRSYNPETGLYFGLDGRYHHCP